MHVTLRGLLLTHDEDKGFEVVMETEEEQQTVADGGRIGARQGSRKRCRT